MAKTKKKPKSDPRYAILTQPDLPDGDVPDRRSVFNSSEIGHRWAGNHYVEGRCGNVFFNRGVIYSYGSHFPMAAHQKNKRGEKFVLMTTRSYSSTTSGHMSGVSAALQHNDQVYRVFDPCARFRYQHVDNLKKIGEEAGKLAEKARRARLNRDQYLDQARRLVARGNKYAEKVGLRSRLPAVEDLAEYQKKVTAKQQAAEKRRLAEEKRRLAEDVANWEQELKEWLAGIKEGRLRDCPDQRDPRHGLTYLRPSGTHTLMSSLGMPLKIKDVLPILDAVRGEVGRIISPPGTLNPFMVEGFQVSEFNVEEKYVRVGCHQVTFDEIERVAKILGK